MSDIEARHDEVAKRYGGVLFNLAQENKTLKSVLKEVILLRQSIQKDPHGWSQVVNPTLSLQTQRLIVESLVASLKLGPLMKRFLIVLCHNRRLSHLNSTLDEFTTLTQSAEGIIEGVLETASELSKKEMDAFQKSLKNQLGKHISLTQVIKENLIAGVVLRIGSLMIDASIGTRLNKLKTAMKG
ncbi:MAG: ATP synthase F1 subunit delta [Alphaproteobacteria bacterium 41-28]|nr:MAG: ATP synthase F1 subunit delta [Alphaproteobacteria bacterium 41-28]